MIRAVALVVALAAGCYRAKLDDAPFTCSAGACPSGYRCVDALCIADGAPDPPILISRSATSSDPAAPQPVPYGSGFGVFYLQSVADGAPGLYFSAIDHSAPARQIVDGQPTMTLRSDVAFSAGYHPVLGSYGVAFRVNDPDAGDHLEVHVLAADLSSDRVLASPLSSPTELGFSAPSVTVRLVGPPCEQSIIVAYRFGDLATYSRDNIFCDRIVSPGCPGEAAALDGSFCYPDLGEMNQLFTAGSYADEVAALDDGNGFVLFWRELGGQFSHVETRAHARLTGFGETSTAVLLGSRVSHVLRGASYPVDPQASSYAVVAAAPAGAGPAPWEVVVGARGQQIMPLAFLSTIVPDVVADATNSRFAMCSLADDGELRIGLVAPDQTASATELRVPRYSDAPIVSCRLALGSSGALGVSWEEYSAPGYSVYFGTVPLPR